MLLKAFFVLLVTFNICLSVPANKFDWESHINDVIQDIKHKNERFDQTKKFEDLPTYDFVVIGSGSGGSTCTAGILEKKPNAKILMIEAGSYDIEDRVYDFFYGAFWAGSRYDWNDLTVFENGLNRQINVPNGFVLGGSSAINFMTWIRGDPNDFNSWASITGDDSWTYENLIPYFKKVEKYRDSCSSYRGHDGDVVVTKKFSESKFADDLCNIISNNLSYIQNQDYNAESPDGIAYAQWNAKPQGRTKGIRQDAFRTQILKYLNKPTFNILTSTYGDKVVLNDANNEVKYLIIQKDGVKYKVRAKKDYIISAGATRTPLFLMRSGIGDLAVVDSKLEVIGVKNLRVVDASVMPHVTSFNTNCPTMTIGMKAAAIILKDRY